MRRIICFILTLLSIAVAARTERDTLGIGTQICFTPNHGQWVPEVLFEAQLHNSAMFLQHDGITIALRSPLLHPSPIQTKLRHHAYRMHFVGCQPTNPIGSQPLEGYTNYFLGNNPDLWRSNVPSFSSIRYNSLYQGIDLEIYSASNALKYNFIVSPGADPSQILIEYQGADGIRISRDGNLHIATSVNEIIELKPYVFQLVHGREIEIASHWTLDSKHRASISIGQYDPQQELIIDPILIFSSYTGSTADNWGATATYDSHKNSYTAGLVFNIGYPASLGAYDTSYNANADIGIFKFDTIGHTRLYATYLGGDQADMPHSLYVNTFDELIVFGTTGSSNFPTTPGAYQRTFRGGPSINYMASSIAYPQGSDLFVTLLSSDGSQLRASTYIGGSGNDGLNYRNYYNNNGQTMMFGNDSLYHNYGDGARGEIITDYLNNVYIGTSTLSSDFPTTNGCVQPTHGGRQDGIVFKLDYNLRNMLWSTYLGGNGDDAVYSIDVDSAYNLLVCGGTNSRNFPTTPGAYQTTFAGGTADGFVSKISYHGNRLIASSYYGSTAYDQLYFVRSGRRDEVLLFGQTAASGSTMIYNAGYSIPGSGMLLARLQPDLSSRVWSTVFGTPGRINLSPTAFAADICNRIYAAGWGRDFVGYGNVSWYTQGTWQMETTNNAYSDSTDGQDFYIISLDDQANTLEYATFFGELHQPTSSRGGGDHVDGGTSRFDRLATLYQSVCASCGGTNGFPTSAGAWSSQNLASNCNNALVRFNVTDNFPVAEFIPPTTGCAPYTVQFRNTGRGTSYLWDFGDGTTSTQREPTHTFTHGGTYTVTLIASMPNGCSASDTQRHAIQVLDNGGTYQMPLTACNNTALQIGPRPQLGAQYQWIEGQVSDSTIANPWVYSDGLYILRITGPGCTEIDTFHVQSLHLVDCVQVIPITCHDSANGIARLFLPNGISPDSLNITSTPPLPYTFGTDRSINFSPLAHNITYTITLEGYGCSYQETFTLTNPPLPHYDKEFLSTLCSDSCTGWIHLSFRDPQTDLPTDTLLSNLCTGTYITRLETSSCPIIDTTTITQDYGLADFHAWADQYNIYLGESVNLHCNGGSDIPEYHINYLWSPASDLNDPTSPNPIATPSSTHACYTVVATSSEGCQASDTVCISCTEVICGQPLFTIPNAFTPNGDGLNDRICFNDENITHFYIAFFNRWGEKVYESQDIHACWDGSFRGSPCPPGVYTYTCHIECHAGIKNDFKGDITLIR